MIDLSFAMFHMLIMKSDDICRYKRVLLAALLICLLLRGSSFVLLMLKAGNEKLQETSQILESIGAKQKHLIRKRLCNDFLRFENL